MIDSYNFDLRCLGTCIVLLSNLTHTLASFYVTTNRPFDVVKTRRQMVVTQTTEAIGISESCTHYGLKEYTDKLQQTSNGKGCKTPGCGTKQLGTFGHMQQIIKQEGVAGLWKGNTTRMIKVAPA